MTSPPLAFCWVTAFRLVVLGSVLTACASATSRSISYLDHPLTPLPDSIAVNTWPLGMPDPDRPYAIVGEVYVQRAAATVMSHVDRQALVNELRSEARRMGADGVIAMMSGNSGVTWRQVDQAWFWGIAVRFLDTWQDEQATQERRRQLEMQAHTRFAARGT